MKALPKRKLEKNQLEKALKKKHMRMTRSLKEKAFTKILMKMNDFFKKYAVFLYSDIFLCLHYSLS